MNNVLAVHASGVSTIMYLHTTPALSTNSTEICIHLPTRFLNENHLLFISLITFVITAIIFHILGRKILYLLFML